MTPAVRPDFRPDLEGLRGVAILLVVLFHAGVQGVAGGFVGVDVFFVLSGFFITGMLVRESAHTGTVNLTEFYGKRALRLLPPLLLVLLVTLALVMWLYAPIDRAAVAANARAVALYSGNIAFANESVDYFSSGQSPLLHTWSLAVEQQFYFLWPVLILVMGLFFERFAARETGYASANATGTVQETTSERIRTVCRAPLFRAVAIVGAISFVASLLLTKHAQPWAFFGMPTRVWEFALGGMVAMFMHVQSSTEHVDSRGTWLQVAGFAGIAFAVVTYDRATPYPGIAALLPACAAILILIGGQYSPSGFVSRSLSTPVLCWFGQVSYAWYLWHWPLVELGCVLNPHIGAWGKLAWCAGALVLAWLTYRFVEQPMRTGQLSQLPPRQLALTTFGATVVAAIFAQGAMVMSHRTMRDSNQQQYAAARGSRVDHGCWGTTIDEPKEPCVFGDVHSNTTVVLFGDSHAEHWLGALDRVGKSRGWKIVLMVKGGCPVSDMPDFMHARLKRYYHECTRFREAMMQRIIAMKPAAAILSSWDHYIPANGSSSDWQVTPEMWQTGLKRTYSRLSAAQIAVIAVRGTPRTWFSVPSCLSRRAAQLPMAGNCEYDLAASLLPAAVAAQTSAARGLNVQFVDMNDQICAATPCSTERNGEVVFTDDNHLTVTFSRSVADVFGARVAQAAAKLGQRLP